MNQDLEGNSIDLPKEQNKTLKVKPSIITINNENIMNIGQLRNL